jgi:hypothetical protein
MNQNTLEKDVMYSINIVCTSIGRTTLPRLIESFKDQLGENDIFTIISDISHEYVSEVLKLYDFKFKVNHIRNEGERVWKYGHPLLNQHMNNLEGDFIMFADDDDRYTPDAFSVIKQNVNNPNKLYIFKHKWGGDVNWKLQDFTIGNVGKCMGVIPNTHNLPNFREDVFGDVYFYEEIGKMFESEFVDHIIYKVRDTE